MKPLPMPLRIAAGLVATAIEETRQLPRKLLELPVTAVSQALQASMRVQQRVTELAIKGDRALGALRPVPETPSWARFDEDELDRVDTGATNGLAPNTAWDGPPPAAPPRKVLPIPVTREPAPDPAPTPAEAGADPAVQADLPPPEPGPPGGGAPGGPAGLEDYDTWTLPQLRARFRSLSLQQVRSLLAWEADHRHRPPFMTMLANRVASITGR